MQSPMMAKRKEARGSTGGGAKLPRHAVRIRGRDCHCQANPTVRRSDSGWRAPIHRALRGEQCGTRVAGCRQSPASSRDSTPPKALAACCSENSQLSRVWPRQHLRGRVEPPRSCDNRTGSERRIPPGSKGASTLTRIMPKGSPSLHCESAVAVEVGVKPSGLLRCALQHHCGVTTRGVVDPMTR